MSERPFNRVIAEHLALVERNKRLEQTMPLDDYREQFDRGTAGDPADQEDPSTDLNVALPRPDPDSWWDSSDERPMPRLDWDDT
jgi:hypothetical protein